METCDRRRKLKDLLKKLPRVSRSDAWRHLGLVEKLESSEYFSLHHDLDAVGERSTFESPILWRARREGDPQPRPVRSRNVIK